MNAKDRWHPESLLLAAAPMVVAVAVWFLFVHPVRRSDFLVFISAADHVHRGVNPFIAADDPKLWAGSAYVYPYVTALAFVPFDYLPIQLADAVWFALSIFSLWYGCRLFGLRDPIGVAAIVMSAACVRSYQVGSINPEMFAVLAFLWRHREQRRKVAVSFTMLVGAKLFLAPMALWLFLARPRRTAAVALLGACTYLMLGFTLGPIKAPEFVGMLAELARHEGSQGMSLAAVASKHRLLAALHIPVVSALLLPGLVLLMMHRKSGHWRNGGKPAEATLFCACLVACLMATPIFWTHYMVLGYIVPLLLRPTRRVALATCLSSWFVSRPVQAPSMFALSGDTRAVAFFGLLAVILAAQAFAPLQPPLLRRRGLSLLVRHDAGLPHLSEGALVL